MTGALMDSGHLRMSTQSAACWLTHTWPPAPSPLQATALRLQQLANGGEACSLGHLLKQIEEQAVKSCDTDEGGPGQGAVVWWSGGWAGDVVGKSENILALPSEPAVRQLPLETFMLQTMLYRGDGIGTL